MDWSIVLGVVLGITVWHLLRIAAAVVVRRVAMQSATLQALLRWDLDLDRRLRRLINE